MSKDNELSPPQATDDPIGGFARCHAGIVDRLESLAGLPGLLEAAAAARRTAADVVAFFDEAVARHHEEEERDLIPAVRASATPGDERARVDAIAARLSEEHRELEALWAGLEPGLKRVAAGKDARLPASDIERLVARYKAHAEHEEAEFLPLAARILGRKSRDLAALGLSLHIRHAKDRVFPYI